jgi:hypothetical protein
LSPVPIEPGVPSLTDRKGVTVSTRAVRTAEAPVDATMLLPPTARAASARWPEMLTLLETLQSNALIGFGFVDRDCRFPK